MTYDEQLAEIARILKEIHEEFKELEAKLTKREEQNGRLHETNEPVY
jgi:single-stranded DNA-specific DHH superfamily exonuclease